ncbi:hypothetical protein M409DRAFT_51371 [Zasmidium cellare ATCC 36951]|uniref:Uncharacterized protein n=1 Tax=Zasmidium cellare ATCC 36951 TaxID=1080233 RepID=A0A6A6CWS8_ZASCE|nr:uncharacterized protein M409DRAFT_51371 [Zasmidium cellare ATCC 36951]KAF2171163.1 hypothetical protein M409DRAFT_51371 [Zasmidium cellare ATCC 36951]
MQQPDMAPQAPQMTPHPEYNKRIRLLETTVLNGIELSAGHVGLIKNRVTEGGCDKYRVEWRHAHHFANKVPISPALVTDIYEQGYQWKGGEMLDFVLRIDAGTEEDAAKAEELGTIIYPDPFSARQQVWMPSYATGLTYIPIRRNGEEVYRILGNEDYFPFRMLHDQQSSEHKLVKAGTEGKIFEVYDSGWVRVAVPQYSRPIHVARSFMAIGKHRISPTSWVLKREHNILAPQITTSADGGLLYRTAYSFFKALQSNRTSLPQIERSILDVLGYEDEGPRRMADLIVDGCKKAGTLEELNSESFTLASICEAGQLIGSSTANSSQKLFKASGVKSSAMIYLIEHGKLRSDPARQNAVYTGSSGDGVKRMGSHNGDSQFKTSPHYLTWRASDRHRMVNICCAPTGQAQEARRFAMETFFIAALDTYAPKLVSDFAKFLSEAQPEDSNKFPQTAIPQAEESAGSGEQEAKATEMLELQDIALRIMSIADVVFTKTGWPRGASRDSFESSGGCNFSTPIGSSSEGRVVFYKTIVPGKMVQYRRKGLKCSSRNEGKELLCGYFYENRITFVLNTGKTKTGKRATLNGPEPKDGDIVYVVYEIWDREQDVPPASWARLPADGEYEYHEIVRRLRVSIEWQDSTTNKWHKIYIVSTCNSQLTVDSPPKSYVQGLAMICALQQRSITNPDPWVMQFRAQPVVQVDWDHLNQVLALSSEFGDNWQTPARVPMHKREAHLRSLGAQKFGGKWREIPPTKTAKKGHLRTTCDRCFVGHQAKHAADGNKDLSTPSCDRPTSCDRVDPTNEYSSCTHCWEKCRIRCAWTPEDQITDEYRNAVLHDMETTYTRQVDLLMAPKDVDMSGTNASVRWAV